MFLVIYENGETVQKPKLPQMDVELADREKAYIFRYVKNGFELYKPKEIDFEPVPVK